MRKTQFPWIIAVILVVGYAGWHLPGLILAALGLVVSYLLSIRIHPRVRHTGWRGCGGTGEHRGAIFTWVHRKCGGCQSGRLVRWGAGQFGAGHIKTEYAKAKQARAKAKQNHAWR